MIASAIGDFELAFNVDLKKEKVLVAVSGGVDSMVLLDMCLKASLNFGVAHVNFGLRGKQSKADEILVKKVCDSHKIAIHIYHPKTRNYAHEKNLSIQMAARELRYAFFEETMKEYGYKYVLTAHHANDNIEHFFIYLLRNNIATAFTGIPAFREPFIRPLLGVNRDEIHEYAEQNNIEWREDKSNEQTHYLRNKVRHLIIPGLISGFPDVLSEFRSISANLQKRAVQKELAAKAWLTANLLEIKGNIIIEKPKLATPLGKLAVFQFLRSEGFNPSQLDDMLKAQSGAIFSAPLRDLFVEGDRLILLPGRYTIVNYNIELLSKTAGIEHVQAGNYIIAIDYNWQGNVGKEENTWYVDADKIEFPLHFRNWKPNDTMQPWGMKGSKKLSDVFTNAKIGLLQKWLYPVVQCENGILGIMGIRQSAFGAADKHSKRVIQIRWAEQE